jgi:hypothetical protein
MVTTDAQVDQALSILRDAFVAVTRGRGAPAFAAQ